MPKPVHYLLTAAKLARTKPHAINIGLLARDERPLPTLEAYDHLFHAEVAR